MKTYKKLVMRQFPGDVSRDEKIAMIEGRSERLTREQQKGYKKELVKRANRRWRRKRELTHVTE